MQQERSIRVIIPALNEEEGLTHVLKQIPTEVIDEIIVVDNGSDDKTAEIGRKMGATVLYEPVKGYGKACLAGLEYVRATYPMTDIIVFLDADNSDDPEQLHDLIKPILYENKDLVVGSRALGNSEQGSLTLPQKFGNWLATRLLRLFYKVRFTDLGPFRAIRFDHLLNLNMQDQNYGWTVEMQLKAAKKGYNCVEVPVNYKNRIGVSKISGSVKGSVMAGYKILYTIFKYISWYC